MDSNISAWMEELVKQHGAYFEKAAWSAIENDCGIVTIGSGTPGAQYRVSPVLPRLHIYEFPTPEAYCLWLESETLKQ